MRQGRRMKILAVAVAFATTAAGTNPARAMVAPMERMDQMRTASVDRGEDLAAIQAVLETKKIRQRLSDLGLTKKEVDARLARLSDEQLHQVAQRLDQQVAAGDDEDVFIGLAIGALLVALIVWLVDAID